MTIHKRDIPFDVEEIFNKFVLQINGELGSKLIRDTNNQPNADYVFKDPEVVAELKCFQKDLFSAADDAERMNLLYKKWSDKGIFNNEAKVKQMLISRQLPEECVKDLLKAARSTIDNVIRHANKQIRETKKFLNMPNAKALLLLCNDGNYYLQHIHFINLIGDIVFNKYKDIDGFIYFTINHASQFPNNEADQHVWFPIFKQNDESFMDFTNKMRLSFLTDFFPKLSSKTYNIIDSTGNELEGYKTVMQMKYKKKTADNTD